MVNCSIILFDYHAETKKGYPIKVVVSGLGARKYINLKQYANSSNWDATKSEPLPNHPHYFDLLDEILKLKIKIAETERLSRLNNWSVARAIDFIQSLDPEAVSFSEFAENYLEELRAAGRNSDASIKSTALKSFLKFAPANIRAKEITEELLTDYKKYSLRSGFTNNGLHTYMRSLRVIYKEATGSTGPFAKAMPKLQKTQPKNISIEDMSKILNLAQKNIKLRVGGFGGSVNWVDYFSLCFLMGGIDFVDLANLRYSEHVQGNRLVFKRFKGGTDEWISNIIPPLAAEILKKYKQGDHLVPIHKASNYTNFRGNYIRRIGAICEKLKVSGKITSKTPRYTFINVAKEVGVPRNATEEIVGHSRNDTHGIYESAYPVGIKNKYHLQVVAAVIDYGKT